MRNNDWQPTRGSKFLPVKLHQWPGSAMSGVSGMSGIDGGDGQGHAGSDEYDQHLEAQLTSEHWHNDDELEQPDDSAIDEELRLLGLRFGGAAPPWRGPIGSRAASPRRSRSRSESSSRIRSRSRSVASTLILTPGRRAVMLRPMPTPERHCDRRIQIIFVMSVLESLHDMMSELRELAVPLRGRGFAPPGLSPLQGLQLDWVTQQMRMITENLALMRMEARRRGETSL